VFSRHKKNCLTNATKAMGKKTPVTLWESYGDQLPKLQRFAIHVITSLTCSYFEWCFFMLWRIPN